MCKIQLNTLREFHNIILGPNCTNLYVPVCPDKLLKWRIFGNPPQLIGEFNWTTKCSPYQILFLLWVILTMLGTRGLWEKILRTDRLVWQDPNIWLIWLFAINMVKWGIPEKSIKNVAHRRWPYVHRTLQSKGMAHLDFFFFSPAVLQYEPEKWNRTISPLSVVVFKNCSTIRTLSPTTKKQPSLFVYSKKF